MKTISLGKSTIYMTLASVGQKLISFVYFAIIARVLGAEDTGKYFFALSFTTIFVVFVDLGLTNVMVREGAKTKEKISTFVSSVLFLKFFLGIFSYLIMVTVLFALHYKIETRTLVFISGVTMLSDSLQLTLYGALRALGNIKYEAFGIVMSQLLTLICGSVVLYMKLPLFFLMYAFLIPSFLNAVFAWFVVTKKYQVRLRPKYSREIIYYIFPIAIPFALATIFGRIFSYADSIILSKMVGDTAVGWYSVPYKITNAIQFIPFALIAGLYPRMSEYFAHDQKRLSVVFSQGLRYLMMISIPFSIASIILAKDLIYRFFGPGYEQSVLPMQILMVGVCATFLNILLGALLNATGRQKIQTAFVGTTMAFNIMLNILLIPRLGVVGAALTGTLSNTILLIISFAVAHRIIQIKYRESGILLTKLLIACAGMWAVLWYTTVLHDVVVRGICGILAFVIVAMALRVVSKEDLQYLASLRTKNIPTSI